MKLWRVGFFLLLTQPALAELHERYLGWLHLDQRGLSQFAKLDLVSYRDNHQKLRIIAVFTLYFGDFFSEEYISYIFSQVEYQEGTNTLNFTQNDQEINLKTISFTENEIVAKVRSTIAGELGTLRLYSHSHATGEEPTVRPLGGLYQGQCAGKSSVIALQTYRSTANALRMGNPFASYKIKGQFAEIVPELCQSNQLCVTNQIDDGAYNFYSGDLSFVGSQKVQQCTIQKSGDLLCNHCSYHSVHKKAESGEERLLLAPVDPFPPTAKLERVGVSDLAPGSYYGYLWHERRQALQQASLTITNYHLAAQNILHLSASANLYFGKPADGEVLSYRFSDQVVSVDSPALVLERTGDDVDAILKITEITKSHLKGVWYSILFGRVGSFLLQKDQLPPPPVNYPLMAALRNDLESSSYLLDLDTYLIQTPMISKNPLYPLALSGYFSFRDAIGSRLLISGGSYDFYTGKIGLEIDHGKRVATGMVERQGQAITLRWSSNGFATRFQDFSERLFKKRERS